MFIGAFVPLVGAFVSGFVAVLVALVALGWVKALIMLAGIIVVMQVEGHVLQPFLLGRAVTLHPLAVMLAIAIGIMIAGIVGALVAVPILAFVKTVHPGPLPAVARSRGTSRPTAEGGTGDCLTGRDRSRSSARSLDPAAAKSGQGVTTTAYKS